MTLKLSFLSILFAGILSVEGFAQDCTVSVPALAGKYEGECKNGKADGTGKATGEDSYEGTFKNGQPDGKGKYTWKNGDWFDGEWSKGMKSGVGIMSFKLANKDSLVPGFWKKDKYVGKFEKPYMIYKNTIHVTSIAFQHLNDTKSEIELFLNSETGGGSPTFSAPAVPKPEITDIQIINGTYQQKKVNDTYAKKIGYLFEEVTFPFRAIFTVNNGSDVFEIEVFESGKWKVEVRTSY
jgi:hypothetical protein